MLYSVTLTCIFKVKLLKWLFWQVNAGKLKHFYGNQIGSDVFNIERRHCACSTSWPWPTFSRSRFLKCENNRKRWELAIHAREWLLSTLIFAIEYCEFCSLWPWPFSKWTFSCYAFAINNCAGSACPRQICLDSHGSRRGVALVSFRH